MQHNLNPFVQDENQLNKFLTSKYGAIAGPFIAWRTTLTEDQKILANPRLLQSMVMIYKGTMSLEKACSIMPQQLDKEHFYNIVNDNILLNFSHGLQLKTKQVKSFNMDEDHVKKFIFDKYGVQAEPFVKWRDTLPDEHKSLVTARIIQNMIHLQRGNLPLQSLADLLPKQLDQTHFFNIVEEQLKAQQVALNFKPNKINSIRNKSMSVESTELKNTTFNIG